MKISALAPAERASFVRICDEGARGAGRALATFIGAPDAPIKPELTEAPDAQGLAGLLHEEQGVVVAFGLSGEASGVLLHMLDASAARRVVARLLGLEADAVTLGEERAQGALAEVGNIVASAFLNAISNRVGAPCLPSVPTLVVGAATQVVDDALAEMTAELEAEAMLVRVELGEDPPLVFALAFSPTTEGLTEMIDRTRDERAGA